MVAIKTVEQQDIQLIHKVRQGYVDKRTALADQIRGLLSESGVVIRQGINQVRKELPFILEDAENKLTPISRELFAEQYGELTKLDEKIKQQDQRITTLCTNNETAKRFLDVPGVGPMTASMIAADICEGESYASSRDLCSQLRRGTEAA